MKCRFRRSTFLIAIGVIIAVGGTAVPKFTALAVDQTAVDQAAAAQAAAAQAAAVPAQTVQMSSMYTYDQMCADMGMLSKKYPDYVKLGSIGTSTLGRNIPYMILGNPNAAHSIMVQSTIHAREYLGTQVVMKMAETYASNKTLLPDTVNYYIVPMANPDGVSIAQFGAASVTNPQIQQFVSLIGHFQSWKANGIGIDLNRNFGVRWETIPYSAPNYMLYKGLAPDSAAEVKALETLAASKNFSAYISYHQMGNLIYYDEPGNADAVSSLSTLMASVTQAVTGYRPVNMKVTPIADDGGYTRGGFTDWVQTYLAKPAMTLELGSGLPPAAQGSVTSIYNSNVAVWQQIAQIFK